jgi:hypothetical protein
MNTRTALILLAIGAAYVVNPMPSFAQARSGGGNSDLQTISFMESMY